MKRIMMMKMLCASALMAGAAFGRAVMNGSIEKSNGRGMRFVMALCATFAVLALVAPPSAALADAEPLTLELSLQDIFLDDDAWTLLFTGERYERGAILLETASPILSNIGDVTAIAMTSIQVMPGQTVKFTLLRPESNQIGGSDEFRVSFTPYDAQGNAARNWFPRYDNSPWAAVLFYGVAGDPPDTSDIKWEFDVVGVDRTEASSSLSTNSFQAFAGHKTDFADPNAERNPGPALVIFHHQVVNDDYTIRDFDIALKGFVKPEPTEIGPPPLPLKSSTPPPGMNVNPKFILDATATPASSYPAGFIGAAAAPSADGLHYGENTFFFLWSKGSGPQSGTLTLSAGSDKEAKFQNPKVGGLYTFELNGLGLPRSCANVLLPLGGPDVTAYLLSEAERYGDWADVMTTRIIALDASDSVRETLLTGYAVQTARNMRHAQGNYEMGVSPNKRYCKDTVTIAGHVFDKEQIAHFLHAYFKTKMSQVLKGMPCGTSIASISSHDSEMSEMQMVGSAFAQGSVPSNEFKEYLGRAGISCMQSPAAKNGWPSTTVAKGRAYPVYGATPGLSNPDEAASMPASDTIPAFADDFKAAWQTHDASKVLAFVEQGVKENATPEALFARGIVSALLQTCKADAVNAWAQAIQMITEGEAYPEPLKTQALKDLGFVCIVLAEMLDRPKAWEAADHAVIFAELPAEPFHFDILTSLSALSAAAIPKPAEE